MNRTVARLGYLRQDRHPLNSLATNIMKICNLPIELIDQSLEHISDKPTLSSCSLVCRSWLNGSRRVLFSTTTIIANPGALALFVDFCQRTSESEANLPSARPCQHVRHLRIHSPGPRDGRAVPKELDPLSPHLEFILSRLEALRSLELQCLKIHNIPRLTIPARLEELTLIGVWTASDTEEEILDLLCQLPSLRSLRFHGHKYTSFIPCRPSGRMPSPGDAAFPTNISRLSTLTLRYSKLMHYFMSLVKRDPPRKLLSSLDVMVLRESDLVALNGLFDLVGGNLHHLGLDLTGYMQMNRLCTCFPDLLILLQCGSRYCPLIATGIDFFQMHVHALTALRAMTFSVDFYDGPLVEIPSNTLLYSSISLLLARDVIRERLEVLTLCIGFDNFPADAGQSMDLARYQLRRGFWWVVGVSNAPHICKIRWKWMGLKELFDWDVAASEDLRRSLNGLVRELFPALNQDVLLSFSDTESALEF